MIGSHRIRSSLAAAVLLALLPAVDGAAEAGAVEDALPEVVATPGDVAQPRIVGGAEVDPPGKYPFVVALVFTDVADVFQGQYCGGALVDPYWVLTAGHCVSLASANQPWEIDVVVGRHDLRRGTDGERIGVAEIHRHPGFDDQTLENDVALLRLQRAATAGAPLPLATTGDGSAYAPGQIATVVGWGATLGQPPGTPNYPDQLREAQVPIVSEADCAAAYGDGFVLPDMMCAGDLLAGGIDSCFGDSGGPLFVPSGPGFLHIGVVSWGDDCALPGFPGVYARTATYADWVASTFALASPTCGGRPATILGTESDDTLIGTEGDDVIAGRGGNDLIRGGGGNDLVCAGAGGDRVFGGEGDDLIYGQGGDDRIEGNRGGDVILGGPGADLILGGAGNDRLLGGAGDDLLWGQDADDTLRGGAGNDRLLGGAGSDLLYGETGDDRLRGGAGNDRIFGGAGADYAHGEAGRDTIDGGADDDELHGGSGDDVVIGGSGADLADGNDGADLLDGGDGPDLIYGGMGDDEAYGGVGDDRIYGQDRDDVLDGGPGYDIIRGGPGYDVCLNGEDVVCECVVGCRLRSPV